MSGAGGRLVSRIDRRATLRAAAGDVAGEVVAATWAVAMAAAPDALRIEQPDKPGPDRQHDEDKPRFDDYPCARSRTLKCKHQSAVAEELAPDAR